MGGFRATFLCGLLLPIWGCEAPENLPRPAPAQDGAIPSQFAGARRPSRTYYLAHTGGRCTVYWVDGRQHSVSRQEPCPRELDPGERARLAGRVCFRESDDHARVGPMRCPQPLVEAARHDRQDGGDKRLPAAGSAAPGSDP